ncbi:hypothetical protein AGDE_16503 [Angomonas deanei]|uniref:Uncharacterized protein n=1 Tax=Angomonas deanei TaxID=59799 RepID=A0A7G2C5E8_9TRYP|nr:hypothetical protein AGDE_16503 [Angomonas deanei]CAD2214361.1 hypothetical protein, conserved [Angomonas deanei]|eukprot:EPY16993.1 hypothetical protein AGDE_16503 [Angomonas deanei]
MSDVNYNLNAILPSIEIHLSESTKEGNENHNSNTKKFKSPFQDYGGYFATIPQDRNNTNPNPFSFPAELHIGLQIRLPHKDYTYCPAEVDRCTTVYTLTHFYPLADIYEAEEVQENSSKEEEGHRRRRNKSCCIRGERPARPTPWMELSMRPNEPPLDSFSCVRLSP